MLGFRSFLSDIIYPLRKASKEKHVASLVHERSSIAVTFIASNARWKVLQSYFEFETGNYLEKGS